MEDNVAENVKHVLEMLSEEDVRRLLEDKSPSSRSSITSRIADSYTKEFLSEKERMAAEQVFRLLVRDTEIKVRTSLAEHLKDSESIPKDIVLSMVNDVAEVSVPMLEFSKVLNDEDLLGIINSTAEIERYVAIARRKEVSEIISGKLVEKGNDEVVNSLLENSSANISADSFEKIISDHKDNEYLMDVIIRRPQLPISAVDKLVGVVSENIASALKQKYHLSGEHVAKEVEKTRETETLSLVRMARSHAEVDDLIGQLKSSERLTPSMILSALCQGNFDFFESSLAFLSNIPVENARTLIADRGELGFRAIYNKSGLPDSMFPAVKLLLKIVRELEVENIKPESRNYSNKVVERILQYSEENPVDNLSYIIALVRRVASS